MNNRRLLYITLVLVVSLATLNWVANAFYFYWTLWWYDVLMHFLGGVSLGYFSLYIFSKFSTRDDKLDLSKAILFSFIFVIVLGGLWEVFEYANNLTGSTEGYPKDVMHDLIADLLGALVAPLIAKQSLKSS